MTSAQTETLKDITAVYVAVEDLSNGVVMPGLTLDAIQTDVELKLRLAGIRVVTEVEGFDLHGSPCVFVTFFIATVNVAQTEVNLMQRVWLDRNAQIAYSATWKRFNLSVGRDLNAQDVRDQIKDLVDWFVNAWLSVNPKK